MIREGLKKCSLHTSVDPPLIVWKQIKHPPNGTKKHGLKWLQTAENEF